MVPGFESVCTLPPSLHFLKPLTFIFLSPREFSTQPLTHSHIFILSYQGKNSFNHTWPKEFISWWTAANQGIRRTQKHSNILPDNFSSNLCKYIQCSLGFYFFKILFQPDPGSHHSGINGMSRYNPINVLDQSCSDKIQCNRQMMKTTPC